MKDQLVKNLHVFILAYALWSIYVIYEEKDIALSVISEQKPVAEAKLNNTKRKLKKIQIFKKNLERSKERVKEVKERLNKSQRQLPSDINDTEVLDIISEIASDLKIVDPSPAPEDEDLRGFYYAKKYSFDARGTYLQFLVFYENLSKSERILNVRSMKLALDEENDDRGRFQILKLSTGIESFRYNPSYEEKSDNQEINEVLK